MKEGLAGTLDPFLDYSEIAAIEVSDKADRPYAAMWRGDGKPEFRVDYSMPPSFRDRYKRVVRTPAISGGATQGFVTVYVDDQALSAQAAAMKQGLHNSANAEIAMLRDHFNGTLLPQLLVLVAGIANFFLQSSALMLTLSVLVTGIFSAFILYDLKQVRDGYETNYISATLNVYLDIYNVFQGLLSLFGIAGSND
jgi:hypothetical protein